MGTRRRLRCTTSDDLDAATTPTPGDVAQSLMFSPDDGRIWLDDQRMMLLHAGAFGALRRELAETLGAEAARALFGRVGYSSGVRDAELVRKRWPDADLANTFVAGPRLHALEGIVKVTPVRFNFDDNGSFYGEFVWHDSIEAEEHIAVHGIGTEPCCSMQVGYASGYASAFLGRLIAFREVECRAKGDDCCRCVGRPAGEWADKDDIRCFGVEHEPRRQAVESVSNADLDNSKKGGREAAATRPMVGLSASFLAARAMLERVASTKATVLFVGESGVGKELFADALHKQSGRAGGPFVAVNCAAIPDTLVEAELFGVERGAYTGATASRPGRFERASGGTLFLDEIASLSLIAQGKFLRVLQEGTVERVGGTRSIAVDVRVVAATNVDLREEVKAGRFREDLFFRLNVCPIVLPPLRERRSDIPLLMEHFLAHYSAMHGRAVTRFSRPAVEALLNYDYPGNIRELQNLVERGVIFAPESGVVDAVHMFRGEVAAGSSFSIGRNGALEGGASPHQAIKSESSKTKPVREIVDAGLSLNALERDLYAEALARTKGNVSAAARLLGLTRAQLDYRLRRGSETTKPGRATR